MHATMNDERLYRSRYNDQSLTVNQSLMNTKKIEILKTYRHTYCTESSISSNFAKGKQNAETYWIRLQSHLNVELVGVLDL